MNGWHISVYRQLDGGWVSAGEEAEKGPRLAVWQGPYSALKWLEALVGSGDVIDHSGNGYPNRLTARASAVIDTILAGPPEARDVWICGPHDIIGPGWDRKTVIHHQVVSECRPDEWLIIEAWDES